MRFSFVVIAFSILIFFGPQSAEATTILVPSQFSTIQAAIDAATSGDEIIVSPGTYYENLRIDDKGILLRSTQPTNPQVVADTVIDGGRTDTVIRSWGKETNALVVSGFTITHGDGNMAGGILGDNRSATIEYNIICDNHSRMTGGGISQCWGAIRNNVITRNGCTNYGGGLSGCGGIIENNLITYNYSGGYGGGANFILEGTFRNNTIYGNKAPYYGGIYDIRTKMRNCILWDNTGGELYLTNNNYLPEYCCVAGGAAGVANISSKPQFINPEGGDFRLRPDSPCIDAGGMVAGLALDILGNIRPYDGSTELRGDGSDIDIGVHEYSGWPVHIPDTPIALSPTDGEMVQSSTTTLHASTFSHPDASATHQASHWQLDIDGQFSSPLHDTGVATTDLVEFNVPPDLLVGLQQYYWRVRYEDNQNVWSDWSVPVSFCTPAMGTTWVPNDYSTIQAAIDAASSGYTIIVLPGVYYERINFNGKVIILRSLDPSDPAVVDETIIDGSSEGIVVSFSGTETEDAVLSGFTIRHGAGPLYAGGVEGNETMATVINNRIVYNSGYYGAGISSCDGRIENNRIMDNVAQESGAGVSGCHGLIRGNTIAYNRGRRSAAVYACNGRIENNIIVFNRADSRGGSGGLDTVNNGVVTNNLIACNVGWAAKYCSSHMYNNTIVGNDSGLIVCRGQISNNIIWNKGTTEVDWQSSTPSYCCIRNWTGGGVGNVMAAPKISDIYNFDASLQSDSPCIDAGVYLASATLDNSGIARGIDGVSEPRGDGSDFDIGIQEFDPANRPSRPTALLPVNGATEVSLTPTLGSSAFSDPLYVHVGSQWQIDNHEDFSSPSFNTLESASWLTSATVSPDILIGHYTYYWRVRHKNSVGKWSDWSPVSSFTVQSSTGIRVPQDYPTIQAAIDAASKGQEIVVAANTYYENLQFRGKNLVLRSVDPTDPGVVANTIIDGSRSGPVVAFDGSESPDCVLWGLTLTRGLHDFGGGVAGNGTLAGIVNCRILDNEVVEMGSNRGYGGGIGKCHGLIKSNLIARNKASECGGGIAYCYGSIEANTIEYNQGEVGGGIYEGYTMIAGNLIKGNTATVRGGGIEGNHKTICNNVIVENYGGGIGYCRGIHYNNTVANNYGDGISSPGESHIKNCIIWGNSGDQLAEAGSFSPDCCCIQDWTGREYGNTSRNPQFLAEEIGDYRLSPLSPCIDAGVGVGVGKDYAGNPRPYDGTLKTRGDGSDYDIGAFEYSGYPSHFPDRPVNLVPAHQAKSVSLEVALLSSPFSASDAGDIHLVSQWQIDPDPTFSAPIFDSGIDSLNLTTMQLSSETLIYYARYLWRVRHRNQQLVWSDWSRPTMFATTLPPVNNVIRVPDDYGTIQAAIDAATHMDEIIVSPGRYFENIYMPTKNIILRSVDPQNPSVVAATIIDGSREGSVVTFSGSELPHCLLAGFTITNGSEYLGGGIYGNYTLATIEDNVIEDNGGEETHSGGGICRCSGLILHNSIIGNTAEYGGGLYQCSGGIENNLIAENSANGYGAGICSSDGIIQGNRIEQNSGTYGIALSSCDGVVWNNLITDNISMRGAESSPTLWKCDGLIANNHIVGNQKMEDQSSSFNRVAIYECAGTIVNNIIWDNGNPGDTQVSNSSIPSYCCIENWTGGGAGNTSEDPLLVDAVSGNYMLNPPSPCIDAGGHVDYLAYDIKGNVRPFDGVVEARGDGSNFDIGAYEYFGPDTGNLWDLFVLSRHWNETTFSGRVDFVPDNVIDTGDIMKLMTRWRK
jgi:pectin methylesterase-like acyl-CoA thioesterase